MNFLAEHCTFTVLTEEIIEKANYFDCGHPDLNEFFQLDCINYSQQLLGKTYCFLLDEDPSQIVCAFTVSNDSIKTNTLPNNRKKQVNKQIPNQKRFKSYPAVLIGRLGVSVQYKRRGIGRQVMDFIKSWFIDIHNKTGCRFIVVDSYNEKEPLDFYTKNGFKTLFSTELQEKQFTNLNSSDSLKSRLMYFDLIVLSAE